MEHTEVAAQNEYVTSYEPIIAWLVNVIHLKVNIFPFCHILSPTVKNWYNDYVPILLPSIKRKQIESQVEHIRNHAPEVITIDEKKEKSKWNKLHPFVKKIFLICFE